MTNRTNECLKSHFKHMVADVCAGTRPEHGSKKFGTGDDEDNRPTVGSVQCIPADHLTTHVDVLQLEASQDNGNMELSPVELAAANSDLILAIFRDVEALMMRISRIAAETGGPGGVTALEWIEKQARIGHAITSIVPVTIKNFSDEKT